MINVILIDDHNIFGEGIAKLISGDGRFNFINFFTNTDEAAIALEKEFVDVVLLDISVPPTNGIDFCKFLKKKYPVLKVLFFSMHFDESIINRALKAGGDGYMTKDSTSLQLFQAIETIYNGQKYFSPLIEDILLKRHIVPEIKDIPILSPREKEILEDIVRGLTSQQIADKLSISIKTVEFHRSNLLMKFDSKNIAELTSEAIRFGIVAF